MKFEHNMHMPNASMGRTLMGAFSFQVEHTVHVDDVRCNDSSHTAHRTCGREHGKRIYARLIIVSWTQIQLHLEQEGYLCIVRMWHEDHSRYASSKMSAVHARVGLRNRETHGVRPEA